MLQDVGMEVETFIYAAKQEVYDMVCNKNNMRNPSPQIF